MKITIEFQDDEANDARTALDGWKWKLAMWDLDKLLRSTVKHGVSIVNKHQQATDAEIDVADKIREQIRELIQEYNLNLDE